MKSLIDTHALIWYADQDHLLTAKAYAAITDPANELLVSAGTIWEISIKSGQNKLKLSRPFRPWIEQAMIDLKAAVLPITIDHADRQATLPHHHRDPFDRLLVSQALAEGVPLVSGDAALDRYGVPRIW